MNENRLACIFQSHCIFPDLLFPAVAHTDSHMESGISCGVAGKVADAPPWARCLLQLCRLPLGKASFLLSVGVQNCSSTTCF